MVSNYILVHGDALVLISRSHACYLTRSLRLQASQLPGAAPSRPTRKASCACNLRVTDRLVQVKVGDWVVFAQPNCYAASYQVKRLLKDFLVGAPEIYGEFLRVLGEGEP